MELTLAGTKINGTQYPMRARASFQTLCLHRAQEQVRVLRYDNQVAQNTLRIAMRRGERHRLRDVVQQRRGDVARHC